MRKSVHDCVLEQLKAFDGTRDHLSPFEWLLVQLFPVYFLGADVFCIVTSGAYSHAESNQLDVNTNANLLHLWGITIVDETQQLLRDGTGFFLGNKGKEKGSYFSALLNALLDMTCFEVIGQDGQYYGTGMPIFSGTGLSIGELKNESHSVLAKRKIIVDYVRAFIDFQQLSATHVHEYLERFLVLDPLQVRSLVIERVSEWLRGRPRFVATFLEEFMMRDLKTKYRGGTRGKFSDDENRLVHALDRFLFDMTSDQLYFELDRVTENKMKQTSKRGKAGCFDERLVLPSHFAVFEEKFRC